MMQTRHADASSRFRSLDDIYYYGGQNGHDQQAVISHRGRNNKELDLRVGDRIGLILFGTRPYVQVPLTFDRALAQELLEDATLGLAGNQTSLGDAIGLAVSELRSRPAKSRVIVILTDGENTAGQIQPEEASQLAAFYGIRVHTIGLVGASPKPGDLQAEVNRIDEEALQSIARTTGGANVNLIMPDGPASIEPLSGMSHMNGVIVEVTGAEKQQD